MITFTAHAIAHAVYLADVLEPVTETQRAARTAILEAAASGSLPATIDAIIAARRLVYRSGGVATLEWRSWADQWLDAVHHLQCAASFSPFAAGGGEVSTAPQGGECAAA